VNVQQSLKVQRKTRRTGGAEDGIGAHVSEGRSRFRTIGRDHLGEIRHDFGREHELKRSTPDIRKRAKNLRIVLAGSTKAPGLKAKGK
jgi:hypothetical protein